MAYLHIQDFQGGLDTRKSLFTAPAGSLRKARNVHLTRGGEIEVRKPFVPVWTVPGTQGLHAVRDQFYVFGTSEAVTVPAGVNYQRLNASGQLARILSTTSFDGRIYVVAEFVDGSVKHFFDGEAVTAWDTISAAVSDNASVAARLAAKIDALSQFSASATGASFTVTASAVGVPFAYSTSAANGGTVDNQTLTATVLQPAVAGVAGVAASARLRIVSGTASAGVNQIASIKIDGEDVLGTAVDWASSNSATASAIAAQINAGTSGYSALASGNLVTLTAAALGTAANGRVLAVTANGDVVVSADGQLSGGVNPVGAQAQIVQFTVGGTFEPADRFSVTLDGTTFSVQGSASGTATFVTTLGSKVYAVTQSLVYFSGFAGDPPNADATAWDTSVTGAGFINMSTQDGGSDLLTGLAVYQSRLAVFSRRNVQLWAMDADPANNQQLQVLSNVGTVAPRSISTFGDVDVFFLSESGVRSLRARDSSNVASAEDVGTAVDSDVLAWVRSQEDSTVRRAVAIVEPFEGRYLLAIGARVYVFSHFPGSDISAWSTYELDEVDGEITDFAVAGGRLAARIGDRICLYGGLTGDVYAEDDEFTYEVVLPFMDSGKPAQLKSFTSVDAGLQGNWQLFAALDPHQPEVTELIANFDSSSYGLQGAVPMCGQSTHFSFTLKGSASGYARLANFIVHYNASKED